MSDTIAYVNYWEDSWGASVLNPIIVYQNGGVWTSQLQVIVGTSGRGNQIIRLNDPVNGPGFDEDGIVFALGFHDIADSPGQNIWDQSKWLTYNSSGGTATCEFSRNNTTAVCTTST